MKIKDDWDTQISTINRKGIPYQKIANILNYGSSTIKGTRFINKAIRNLKDMDARIYERFQKKIK